MFFKLVTTIPYDLECKRLWVVGLLESPDNPRNLKFSITNSPHEFDELDKAIACAKRIANMNCLPFVPYGENIIFISHYINGEYGLKKDLYFSLQTVLTAGRCAARKVGPIDNLKRIIRYAKGEALFRGWTFLSFIQNDSDSSVEWTLPPEQECTKGRKGALRVVDPAMKQAQQAAALRGWTFLPPISVKQVKFNLPQP
jgi:hypothetical protein